MEIARRLLDAGAAVDALADTYGGGSDQTTMNLLVSSAHPGALRAPLVDVLIDHGAAVDGLEGDGSPLMTALGFGYLAAAETLVRRGARIDNVAAAAALGRLDEVRGFAPTDQALIWAAKFGRTAVVEFLLDHGADITASEELMPLHWAAAFGHMDTIEALLARGAPLEALNDYGGTVLDSTLWFVFNGPAPGVDYPRRDPAPDRGRRAHGRVSRDARLDRAGAQDAVVPSGQPCGAHGVIRPCTPPSNSPPRPYVAGARGGAGGRHPVLLDSGRPALRGRRARLGRPTWRIPPTAVP